MLAGVHAALLVSAARMELVKIPHAEDPRQGWEKHMPTTPFQKIQQSTAETLSTLQNAEPLFVEC